MILRENPVCMILKLLMLRMSSICFLMLNYIAQSHLLIFSRGVFLVFTVWSGLSFICKTREVATQEPRNLVLISRY